LIYKHSREEKLIFIFNKNRAFRPDSLGLLPYELQGESENKIGSMGLIKRYTYGHFVID
jgi:hypothetical protein